jgi:hypothetical protein
MGGKFHLRLNTGERPIANKYREGKMKRTLKRELKVLEIVEGEANGSRGAPRFYVGARAPAFQREALVSVG